MQAANFSDKVLAGEDASCQQALQTLQDRYGFDFVAFGLTPSIGAALKWVYSVGATGERYRRIVLTPGRGIGGIVLKTGKPMMFADIDREMDPREYSSYPIVFAEDLRSFCALPLMRNNHVLAVLLCAFRTASEAHEDVYSWLIDELGGSFCDLEVVSEDFLDFEKLGQDEDRVPFEPFELANGEATGETDGMSAMSRVLFSNEQERKRLARELHDGIAQELLGVSFLIRSLSEHVDDEGLSLVREADGKIDGLIDELRDITVNVRPSALDHLGLVAALHSHAVVFEKMYGARIVFDTQVSTKRFDREFETQVYRICQEAMLNACKYSQAESVHVSIEETQGRLLLEVRDHGCGFDIEYPKVQGSGYGLLGMRERARLIGAHLGITSGKDGTVISLDAPTRER